MLRVIISYIDTSIQMGSPGKSASKESAYNAEDPGLIPWSGRSLEKGQLLTPVYMGFPGGSDGKESACNAGVLGSVPGWGRSPGEGHGNPLQDSYLENPHGQRSLVGYNPLGNKELDTNDQLSPRITNGSAYLKQTNC